MKERNKPEEFVSVFHKLRFQEIRRACPDAESVKIRDEGRQERMVRV